MIPSKLDEGSDTYGLLAYLYGPGRRDEHIDPHMVAAWDPFIGDPARSADMTIADLALLLDAPVFAMRGKKPRLHVYHVSVRNDAEDRILSDEEWAEVACEMMHASGIAEHGDDEACRWLAVRHADDHIHLVATKVREDGRQPNLRGDIFRMQAAARGFEEKFGLRRLKNGDKTASRWRKSGELEKAERRGLDEAPRVTLQRTVREAAAAAMNDADFFARLAASGVRVKQRIAPDGSLTGYSVAMPGDRNPEQKPVWFAGARLAPDLSLPRVRERWASPVPAPRTAPAEVWRVAEEKVREAAGRLGAEGLRHGAGEVAALGDLIVVAAVVSPRLVRAEIRQAAWEFERASRAPGDRALEGQSRGLYRESAYLLSRSVSAAGRGSGTVAALGFLVALAMAVEASRRWHDAQEHRAQARASGAAGRLLREAVEVTAGAAAAREFRARSKRPSARPGGLGRAAAAGEGAMAGVLRQAVPDHAVAILADPAWPALRERLVEVGKAGDDAGEVLAAVAARRELGSAESVAEVLTWRLEGWRRERGSAGAAPGGAASSKKGGAAGSGAARTAGASGPVRRPEGGEQRKGPRRSR
ncbi:relaxase/mobilization nuclease domain-containing protein [Streptomyces tsukubensis]|uniref:relaxase/mobilization nuclease domain-containing protein n=1 Tax=Streptomyces tsukubensis TaxID=83656 RepID=UPI00344F9AB8